MTDELTKRQRAVLEAIAADPYLPRRRLEEAVDLDTDAIDDALSALTEEHYVITMTRQSGSSHESRVSEDVYLVNPERENDV